MSVSIANCVSVQDLKESFKAPFREADLDAFPHEFGSVPCTTEEEYEAAIRDTGVLIDRLTLIEVDMAARFDLLKRCTGTKRIEGYREFGALLRELRRIAMTAVYHLQAHHITKRMLSGLSLRSITPAIFPVALTMGFKALPSESPDLLTLPELSVLLGQDEMVHRIGAVAVVQGVGIREEGFGASGPDLVRYSADERWTQKRGVAPLAETQFDSHQIAWLDELQSHRLQHVFQSIQQTALVRQPRPNQINIFHGCLCRENGRMEPESKLL